MVETEKAPSPLQREIRQGKPFRSTSHEATVGLLRTADVVRQHLSDAIAPSGLTFQQYNVLRILRGAGEAGLPTLEITLRLVERAPGITRLLDRLEAKGLVRRERCPHDRRQVLCWPTARALEILAGLDPTVDRADETSIAALDEAGRRRLIELLDGIRNAHDASRTQDKTGTSPKPPRRQP